MKEIFQMRIQFRRSATAIAAAAVVAAGLLTVSQLRGQTPAAGQGGVMIPAAGQVPRMGNRPNLNGIWQAANTANWDLEAQGGAPATIVAMGAIGATPPGLGVVEGGRIPYQPWALERKQDNYRNRATRDPEVKCHLPGIPRATYLPYPFQIFYSNSQGRERMAIVYQYSYARREINMGKPTEAPIDTWMGWPNAHWEGDTLVIDVSAFIQPIVLAPGGPPSEHWFDRAGNFHSEALHVVERFTPMGANHLLYEANIEDPKVFTRPWKISMPLYRRMERNAQLLEFKCPEYTEEMLWGHLRRTQSD
jgi:hypothetical protein